MRETNPAQTHERPVSALLTSRQALPWVFLVATSLVACSGRSDRPGTRPDGGSRSAPDGATFAGLDAGPRDGGATQDAAEEVPEGFRLGIERRVAGLDLAPHTPSDAHPLRCPHGTLATGLQILGPVEEPPPAADRIRLGCAPVEPDGTVGETGWVDVPFDVPADWIWHPVDCPANTVVRQVHAWSDGNRVTKLGLRCAPPSALADGGGAGAAEVPSIPADYGASVEGAQRAIGCADGAGLGGLALGYTILVDGGSLESRYAGFDRIDALCRDLLVSHEPDGAPGGTGRPFGLGELTEIEPIALSDLGVPDVPPEIVDCPPGAFVSAIDAGRTSPAASPISDLQITCRTLGRDGHVGPEMEPEVLAAGSVAPCLIGSAVLNLGFGDMGAPYHFSHRVTVECSPAAALEPAQPGLPRAAPVAAVLPSSRTTACPSGAVLAGLGLYGRFTDGTGVLGAVSLRCRPAGRM